MEANENHLRRPQEEPQNRDHRHDHHRAMGDAKERTQQRNKLDGNQEGDGNDKTSDSPERHKPSESHLGRASFWRASNGGLTASTRGDQNKSAASLALRRASGAQERESSEPVAPPPEGRRTRR